MAFQLILLIGISTKSSASKKKRSCVRKGSILILTEASKRDQKALENE